MPVETLSCPKCAAPLRQPPFEGPWLCVYCNSLLRVQLETGVPQTSLQSELDAAAMQEVKQLLISGLRDEAVQRYRRLSGVDLEQARWTIDQLAADISVDTIFRQQLTPTGIAQFLGSLILLPASLLALGIGRMNPWVAVPLAALAAFTIYAYWRGALVTLRYWNAPVVPAETRHFTHIGAVQRGRLQVHTYKIVLEVRPIEEKPFLAEVLFPVREENIIRIKQGKIIQVKYLPGQPGSVIYHQT